jgi:Flp pilus assembly pilin Flp
MDLLCNLFGAPHRLRTDRSGVTMLEYAIMGSIIAAVLVIAVPQITAAVSTDLRFMADQIPAR